MVSLVTTCANRLQVDRRFKKNTGWRQRSSGDTTITADDEWWVACSLRQMAGKGFQANVRFPPFCRIDTFPPRNRKTGLPAYGDHIKFL